MTDTTLTLDHVGTAVHETAVANVRTAVRETRGTRLFSGTLVAAVVTAAMVVIGSGLDRADVGSEMLGWVGLWAIAFMALMGGAGATRWLMRKTRPAWAAWQRHCAEVRTEEMLYAIKREDPLLFRELQIIRDRTDWTIQRPLMH